MSALIYFSGGIDSTVLAFDVAKHPYRYGVSRYNDSKNGPPALLLLSYSGVGESEQKRKNLTPIVDQLRKSAVLPIEHYVEECHLDSYEPREEPEGGFQSTDPLILRYRPDILSLPFTAGQTLWSAAYAINYLRGHKQPWSPCPAMYGFQFDGPRWIEHSKGTLRKTDISPEFVASLNAGLDSCGEDHLRFRAPYLEWRMDRPQIVMLGKEIGAPLHLSSSCTKGWKANCGLCSQCMRRARTFRHLGVTDV